jgi:hypothetical protein
MNKYVLVLVICLLVLFAQKQAIAEKIKFYEDPDLMEQELLKHIPLGTPINEAMQVMKNNGFKCEIIEDGRFSDVKEDENASGRIRQTVYENVDFLYCDISKGFFIVARRWQVSLVYEQHQVTQISVSTGLVGP